MKQRVIVICLVLTALIISSQTNVVYADNIEVKVVDTENNNNKDIKNKLDYLYRYNIIDKETMNKSLDTQINRKSLIDIIYNMDTTEYKIRVQNKYIDLENIVNTQSIYWAKDNNIMTGYTDNTFRPDENITIEQLAVVLYRYNNYKGNESVSVSNKNICDDYMDISDYAKEAVSWAISNKIISLNNNKIQPKDNITLNSLIDILYNYLSVEGEI